MCGGMQTAGKAPLVSGIAVAEPGTWFHTPPRSLAVCTQGQVSGQKEIFEKPFLPWGFFVQKLEEGFPWQRLPTAAREWDWFGWGHSAVGVAACHLCLFTHEILALT